jgi:uncharacterized protein
MDAANVTSSSLRALYGEPSGLASQKAIPRLDKHCRAFIARSPFLVLGTAGKSGQADVSPRGDPPGFVAVLDDATLLIPDRPGNNRIDSLGNVAENPEVALIFFVPGMNETLRINGTATVTHDPALLAPLAVLGRAPRTGIVVRVREAYLHCAKALIRSKLWAKESQIDRGEFPSLARMINDQIGGGVDIEAAEARTEDAYKNKLY